MCQRLVHTPAAAGRKADMCRKSRGGTWRFRRAARMRTEMLYRISQLSSSFWTQLRRSSFRDFPLRPRRKKRFHAETRSNALFRVRNSIDIKDRSRRKPRGPDRFFVSSQLWGFGRNVDLTVTVQEASQIYFRARNFGITPGHKTENKNDASDCCTAREARK